MRNRLRGLKWLWLYTAIWLAGAATLALIVARNGRSLIWSLDGIKQHYTALGIVRQSARDVLAGRGFAMVNFSLGQGLDVLTTCAHYGLTDPINLLAALVSRRHLELAYNLLVLLRMYLAGAAFMLYARRMGAREDWATAVAGAIYVYGNFCLRMLGRHPFFFNGPMYLPLLLLGVERVLRERRWLMYVLVTALMLAASFYFAYMNTLVAVLYILLRLAFRLRTRGVKASAGDGFRLLGGYLLGAALAAAVFWPVARLFLASGRVGVDSGYGGPMLFYGMGRVGKVLEELFTPAWRVGRYLNAGFLPLALPGLVGLCCRRDRGALQARIGVALCLAGLCVPLVGYVMNGMAYVEDRWTYVLSLPVALGSALGLPELMKGGNARRWVAAGVTLAWAAGVAVASRAVTVGVALLAATALVPLSGCLGRREWPRRGLAVALTAVCCAVYIGQMYRPAHHDLISEQMAAGVDDTIRGYTAAQDIDDGGVYRVEQAAYDDAQAPLLGYMGTSFYWSMVPGAVSDYYAGVGLPHMVSSFRVQTLGGSAPMNAVASVKYYLQKRGKSYVVPYGFEPAAEGKLSGDGWTLYENALWLPLGYAFDETMSLSEYESLPAEDRLQAITRYAVCDAAGDGASGFTSEAVELAVEIEPVENVEIDGDRIVTAKSAGGRLRLRFDAPEDAEIYLLAEGLELAKPRSGGPLTLSVEGANGVAKGAIRGPENNFYFQRPSFAFCLGTGPMDACELTLPKNKTFDCRSLRVVALPLAGYRASVEARRAEAMTDVTLGRNRVAGRIEVAGDRVLQIALPWTGGWRIWVDGVEQEAFRCGGMYTGVAIAAGSHDIEMRYFTPGLKAGLAVSGAALALLAVLLLAGRRARREK